MPNPDSSFSARVSWTFPKALECYRAAATVTRLPAAARKRANVLCRSTRHFLRDERNPDGSRDGWGHANSPGTASRWEHVWGLRSTGASKGWQPCRSQRLARASPLCSFHISELSSQMAWSTITLLQEGPQLVSILEVRRLIQPGFCELLLQRSHLETRKARLAETKKRQAKGMPCGARQLSGRHCLVPPGAPARRLVGSVLSAVPMCGRDGLVRLAFVADLHSCRYLQVFNGYSRPSSSPAALLPLWQRRPVLHFCAD